MSVISWIRDLFVKQEDREYECMSKCMEHLSPREREIAWTLGFQREDHEVENIRQMRLLAAKLGITDNGLMSEVRRLKAKLRHCVRKCMSEAEQLKHARRKNGKHFS